MNEDNKKIIEDLNNTIKDMKEKMELDFEKKIKILTLNSEMEIRKLEDKYNENTKDLKKKLIDYEENMKKLSSTSKSDIMDKKKKNE